MKILFAEDDRDLCRAMEALLKHAGYTVDVVNNGRDALDFCAGRFFNTDGKPVKAVRT